MVALPNITVHSTENGVTSSKKRSEGPVAVSAFERDAKSDGPKGIEHKVKDPPVQESRGEKSPRLGPDGVVRNTVDSQEADRRLLICKLPQRG